MTGYKFGELLVAAVQAALEQKPLPRCAEAGCAHRVINSGPTVDYGGMTVHAGPLIPTSIWCWRHANRERSPEPGQK